MDRAAAREICWCEGVGKVKALEVRILWLLQVIKARTLVLKTVKSVDNCADLETKRWAAGTLNLLGSMNGFGQQEFDKRGITVGGSCDDLIWGTCKLGTAALSAL